MKISESDRESYCLSEWKFEPSGKRRYVVFDLEATGADAVVDSVTQIGAVVIREGRVVEADRFVSLIKPWKRIPEFIEQLTGITNEMVAGAEEFGAVWRRFEGFCGDSPLVTQCGYEFDFPAMDRECGRCGLPTLANERLDTKAIFAMLHTEREETFSTDFLVKHYGIDARAFRRHDAMGDAMIVARIFQEELEEMGKRGIRRIETTYPVRIRKFVLP